MKYYIIKANSHKVNTEAIIGLKTIDSDAEVVHNLSEADKAILQKGWSRSKNAVAEYHLAREKKIPCVEMNIFIDKHKVHLN